MPNLFRMMMAAEGVDVFTPPDAANLLAWYRADRGIAKDGDDLVSQWDDQQGSRDLTEATNKPKWFDNQINGRPIVRFDGADDTLEESGGTILQPVHIFAVVKQLSWVNNDLIHGTAGLSFGVEGKTSTPNVAGYAGLYGSSVSLTLNTAFLLTWFASGANGYLTLNDDAISRSNASGNSLTVGIALASGNSGTRSGNVEFAEYALYTAEVTGGDLTSLQTYFNNRYNLW